MTRALCFAEFALLVNFAAQERMLFAGAIGDRTEALAHAPVGDHSSGELGDLGQVVFSAGAVFVEDEFFGRAAAEHEDQAGCSVRISPMLRRSSSGNNCVTPSARPRGMMVTLCTRSTPGRIQASKAWPAS